MTLWDPFIATYDPPTRIVYFVGTLVMYHIYMSLHTSDWVQRGTPQQKTSLHLLNFEVLRKVGDGYL